MSEILEEMFSGLTIYIWNNPLDDDDFGAIIIKAYDYDRITYFSDNVSNDLLATSFDEFVDMLKDADISFFDISDKTDMYVYTE